jgi:hypothetical protein
MIAVTLWFWFFTSANVICFLIAGLLTGLLIDVFYLIRLMKNLFYLPGWVLVGFYLFYNVTIYGFFMGFPVFNLVMGAVAGYYFGRRINYKNITSPQRETINRKVSLFTAMVMLLICISTGLMAISEKTMGVELQNMFRIKFEITKSMIIGIILIGGFALIIGQYYVTKLVMRKTIFIEIK